MASDAPEPTEGIAARPSVGMALELEVAQPAQAEGDDTPGGESAWVPSIYELRDSGNVGDGDCEPSDGITTPKSRSTFASRSTAGFWRRSSVLRPMKQKAEKAQPKIDPELAFFRNMDNMDQDGDEYSDRDPLSKALHYIRAQRDLLKSGNATVIEEETRLKAWIETEELEMLLKEEVLQRAVRRWIRFDLVFGAVICLNGIFMGLTTQDILDESSILAKLIELVFLTIFIVEWCIRWYYKPTGFRGMLKDSWSCFDFIIIVVSFIDAVILGSLNLKSGASLLTALRVVRLLRLVRLVRLFKLLKKLWMLVSGMMESFRILFWSLVMMTLFCYIFGLFLLEIIRTSELTKRKPEAEVYWGSVTRCMLSMAEIGTHNGQFILLELAEEVGMLTFLVLIVFIFIVSLGLLNLVKAVQMTSSLRLARKDDQYEDVIRRVLRHRALRRLREMLYDRCIVETGTQLLTRSLLLKWAADEDPVVPRSRSDLEDDTKGRRMSLTTAKSHAFKDEIVDDGENAEQSLASRFTDINTFLAKENRKEGLARHFIEAGVTEDEINMIFVEIDVINGSDKSVHLDEFIDSCMLLKNRVHELDFVSLSQNIQSLHHRLAIIKTSMTDSLRALDESGEQVHALLKTYHAPANAKEEEALLEEQGDDEEDSGLETPPGPEKGLEDPDEVPREVHEHMDADARQKAFFRTEQETLLQAQETIRIRMRENWARFDLVFSLVVGFNCAMLGVEAVTDQQKVRDIRNADFDTVSMVWFLVENFFTLVYISELIMRVVFIYQMTVQNDFRRLAGVFPKLLIMMDRSIAGAILASFPRWLRDLRNFLLLDVFVIVTGIFDNLLLRFASVGGDYSKFLKLVGLLRLLRMARLLKLVRPLSVLLRAFMVNLKIIFWSLVMLICMIYAGAIAMVQILGRDEAMGQDPVVQAQWSHVGTAMLTLGEMVTYTNWRDHIAAIEHHGWWISIGAAVFIGVTSMGILNLVTGVMVQVAFNTVVGVNWNKLNARLTDAKRVMQDSIQRAAAKQRAVEETDKEELQRNVRWFRQAAMQSSAAAQLRESKRLSEFGVSNVNSDAYTNFRRSRNLHLSTSDQLEQVALGVVEQDEETDARTKSRSSLNKRNYCKIQHAFWTADGDICIGIVAKVHTSRRGSGDPMKAALIWDTGRTNPVLYMSDMEMSDNPGSARASEKDGPANNQRKDSNAGLTGVLPQGGKRVIYVGDLFFLKVPMGTDLQFQWGVHYNSVRVYPVKAFMAFNREIRLADIVPTGQDVLTIKMLRTLVQDPAFLRSLAQIDLRPEQALMTYGMLNVIYTGQVRVVDFIDGLLRVRHMDVGLDTAGAKSLLRRLLLQVGQLSKEAMSCNLCFSHTVQTLRGVTILEQDYNDNSLDMVDEDAAVVDRQQTFAKQNQKLQAKIDRLQAYVKRRKAELGVKGELGFGRAPIEEEEEEEEMSITSASPGWD